MPERTIVDQRRTPRELGYRFPAEWEAQSGTWFSWPRPEGISFPDRYDPIPPTLARIFNAIADRQAVHVNVPNAQVESRVSAQLQQSGCDPSRVTFHHIPTNECWCRDHGPAFVVRTDGDKQEAAVINWGFNAWGGKYPPWDDDDRVPARIAEKLGLAIFDPRGPDGVPIIMEGGAIDVNGAGTLLTTTDCLLNPNRNPGLSREQIERALIEYYGQRRVCWLDGGIAGDDTDGHVDDLARFVDERTIVVGVEMNPDDANHAPTIAAAEQARALRDADDRAFEVVEVPMPAPVLIEGERMPATYMNFLFINGALLVPTYRDPLSERRALGLLSELCPNHEVIGIDCSDLIWGLGAIHCLSQQVPASVTA